MKWTAVEIRRLKEAHPYTPNNEIAAELGRSEQSVRAMANRLGLIKSSDHPISRRKVKMPEVEKMRARIRKLEGLLGQVRTVLEQARP
jgi:hypothetical protein